MVFKKFKPKRDFAPKIYEGKWKCADCGSEITELPFMPSPDKPVYCRNCWSKRRRIR